LVVTASFFSISTNIAIPPNGICGHALSMALVDRINYPWQRISFIEPNSSNPCWQGHELKFELIGEKPFVDVPIKFPSGKRQVYKLLLDTGAGLSAALFMDNDASYEVPEKHIHGSLGRGLSGALSGKVARVKKLSVGKFELDAPVVAFPDSQSVDLERKPAYHVGILGANILKRFNVYLSYQDETMWLRRNRYFNDRFRYNTSGLEVHTPVPGVPLYEIENVRPGSVGDEAGIQPGDQLVEVDGELAYRLSLNDITSTLSARPGKKVRLTVKRNGEVIRVKLKMREEL
jgi:hypothetical protein